MPKYVQLVWTDTASQKRGDQPHKHLAMTDAQVDTPGVDARPDTALATECPCQRCDAYSDNVGNTLPRPLQELRSALPVQFQEGE